MSLQFNMPFQNLKAFPGSNIEQMPVLIGEGRDPISVLGWMWARLQALDAYNRAPKALKPAYEPVMRALCDNYADTGDASVRHSDGRFKIGLGAQYLRQLNHQTRLVNGGVPLTDDAYSHLDVPEFSAKQVERYFNRPLSRAEAEKHPGWEALFGGDRVFQKEAVGSTFALAKEWFGYDGKMMGVYAQSVPKEGADGRLWTVLGLGGIDGSGAVGGSRLGDDGGRLVGVAPEAQRAAARPLGQTLEQRV